jgi:hypothetical protein
MVTFVAQMQQSFCDVSPIGQGRGLSAWGRYLCGTIIKALTVMVTSSHVSQYHCGLFPDEENHEKIESIGDVGRHRRPGNHRGCARYQQLAQLSWRSLEKLLRRMLEKLFLDPRHRSQRL